MPWKLAHKKRNSTNFQIPDEKQCNFLYCTFKKPLKTQTCIVDLCVYFPFLAEEELALSFYASCSARCRQKTVLAAIFANFSHEKCPGKVKMAQKWSNRHGIIVLYPGRVFGDDMAIPGLLWGICAIFSQWLFFIFKIAIFRPPQHQMGAWRRLKWP